MNTKSKENKLIKACKRCDLKQVEELITSNKTINFKKTTSNEPQKSQTNENAPFDINFREPKFQMTPLMVASLRGSRDIVVHLIKYGANVSLSDIKGNTALQLACMKQRFHVIDALIQNKANPNDVNMSGWNCLISAVNYFHEDSATMLLLLLQTGAKSEHKDNLGLMCIDHAVRKNKINAIRVILNFNPILVQQCGRALINASIKGYFDIVLLLLNYGVNPNKIDIITGTAPLHEAVRYNDIKDEKNQLERLKIVHYLAKYGADPELANVKRETPMNLANTKQPNIAEKYIQSMKAFYSTPHRMPKFLNTSAATTNYPILKPNLNWTRDNQRFCSSPNLTKENSVTNLIDGNQSSMWTIQNKGLSWVIFDLKAIHVISKIRIYCWQSKEMPSDCYLQVSNSMDGPWNNVQAFTCEMIGSNSRKKPGVPVDIHGFNAIARFWRLVIGKNHGASVTSFHGVEFFGYDYRIVKLIEQLKLTEYEEILVENDLNQIESLLNCTFDQFEKLPIENSKDREKLWNYILEFQRKVQPLKKLDWFNEPMPYGLVGKHLPAFSVTSTSFLTDTLQLIAHGGAILSGETSIDMEPGGMNEPSMAIFRNISIKNSGKYLFEIRSVKKPGISISSQPIQIFESDDPEYEKVMSKTPNNFTQNEIKQDLANESDEEDGLDQIYGFADFSNEHSSKMKINKWLSKSQDRDIDESESPINGHQRPALSKNSYLTGNELNEKRESRLTRFSDMKTTNEILYLKEDYDQNDNDDLIKKKNSNDQKTQKNHLFSAHLYSIKHSQEEDDFDEREYEIQTSTLDFSDELSISSHSDFKYLNRLSHFNGHAEIEPKTEARVFVNNPEIVVHKQSPRQLYELVEDPGKTNQQRSRKMSPTSGNSFYAAKNNFSKASNKPSENRSMSSSLSPPRQIYGSHVEPFTQISLSNNNQPNYSIKSQNSAQNTKSTVPTGPQAISENHDKQNQSPPSRQSQTVSKRISSNSSTATKFNNNTSFVNQQQNNHTKSFKSDIYNSLDDSKYNVINVEPPLSNSITHNNQRMSFKPPLEAHLINGNHDSNNDHSYEYLHEVSNSITIHQPPSPSFPPPPPPPPPLAIQNLDNNSSGYLKARSSNSTAPNLNGKMSLQQELEQRLRKKKSASRKSSSSTEESTNNHNIVHRFDPTSISTNHGLSNGSNDFNGIDIDILNDEFNNNETFTSKAKKALESYKVSKTGSSSSSNDGSSEILDAVKIKKSSSKAKHAPLPFRNDQNEPKFVD